MVSREQPSTIPGTVPTAASHDGGAWSATQTASRYHDVTPDDVTVGGADVTGGLSALREVGVTLLSSLQENSTTVGSNINNTSSSSSGNDSFIISTNSSLSSYLSEEAERNVGRIFKDVGDVTWTYAESVTQWTTGTDNVSSSNSSSNVTESLYELQHPAMGIMLALFSFVVITGNVMVIVAVFKELYLRSVTNYFIVSLAIADVMVGGVVMPFAISHEMTNEVWLYGQEWCDLWHSLDVLASTASILNLCVISLDRYWAITDPINYPSRMSNSKVCLLITLVWLCSAGISFPAIAWWKAVTPPDLPEHECLFTEDSGYLIISSLISFYIPTFIMMFVYAKIYRAAAAQSEGIKAGSKIASNGLRGDDGEVMTLRIHRGGFRSQEEHSHLHHHHHHHHSNGGGGGSGSSRDGGGGGSGRDGLGGSGGSSSQIQYDRSTSDSDGDSPCHSTRIHVSDSNSSTPRPAKHITKRLRHFAISKKLTKLAREQKAAKTLGIVVGVFIICWLPFFVTNVLYGVCKLDCITNPDVLFPVVTWLGYINSGMNPIIYALSMRDFRRAFSKMIFCCCPRYRYQQHQRTYHHHNSMSTSSFSAACGDKCVALKI